jgi:serine/threonine protein phosphatase PrpC
MKTYRAFHATVTGVSHSKQGRPCEDYSAHFENDVMAAAVVADGHGDENCFRSAKGAELAAKCAIAGICEFIYPQVERKGIFRRKSIRQLRQIRDASLESQKERDKLMRDMIRHIVLLWRDMVEKDLIANPVRPDEIEKLEEKYRSRYEQGENLHHAYGTTLIACALTDDYWFGFHIGDGRFTALYNDGSYDQPVPWDDRCYLNVTTSICDDDAAERARFYFSLNGEKAPPVAVYLCSDGVDDNYPMDDAENAAALFKLYRTISETFAEDGFDSTCAQLKDLCTSFATKGKGDDTSIAGMVDMSMVAEAARVWGKQEEEINNEPREQGEGEL